MATKNTPKVNIEALLAKKDAISNAAIKAALVKLDERKQKEQEELIIEHLSQIQLNTQYAVNLLRQTRKREKLTKDYLTQVAEAEQEFYQNADYKAYSTKVNIAFTVYNTELRRNQLD